MYTGEIQTPLCLVFILTSPLPHTTGQSFLDTCLPKMGDKGGYRQINKALNICAFEDYLNGQIASLPSLPNVEQVTDRVLRVSVG